MKRDHSTFLCNWLESKNRRPLVIRGARQTGKTWSVRDLADSKKYFLIELNFERRPDLVSLFSSNDPKEILDHLSAMLNKEIDPLRSILFLDEIQAAPHLLAKLRWFAEEMPELPVVAAGSLLDFALSEHEFSMPVGRIGYLYIEPFSFEEFLSALGHEKLRDYLNSYDLNHNVPETIHTQLTKKIKEYLIVGGMPACVSSWASEQNLNLVHQTQFDLLATYRDDFSKYKGSISTNKIEQVFVSVPRQLGRKFVYSNVDSEVSSKSLKQALELLFKARVCHQILSTAANGLPLAAESNPKFIKAVMIDCGLCGASLGLSLQHLHSIDELSLINGGGMAEQLVAQLLRTIEPAYIPPSLYYWQREKKGSEAEVDFIIQHQNQVIPIEVKAGAKGKLKSLHSFMIKKNKKLAVRIYSNLPQLSLITTKDSSSAEFEYTLLSIPFYLIGQLPRLLQAI